MGDLLKRHDVWIVPTLVWSRSLRPLSRGDDGTSVPLEYVPSAARARLKARRAGYLATVTEADLAAASDVARVSARAVRAMHDAGARVLAGTDAFDGLVLPGFSLHQELALLVEAGLTPLDALRSATLEAAAYRGDLDLEGTITKGKRANLVLLDADPLADISNAARIHAVVASGRLYRRADLDGLLARARNAAR
jgi:imidazolonepropionase-like amidohydrolase